MTNTKTTTPINQCIKQHLVDPYGEIRLCCIDTSGHKIWARTNFIKGVLALIGEWRSLGYKYIEVFEPPSCSGVTQFWDVQESNNLKSKRLSSEKVSLLEFVTAHDQR